MPRNCLEKVSTLQQKDGETKQIRRKNYEKNKLNKVQQSKIRSQSLEFRKVKVSKIHR